MTTTTTTTDPGTWKELRMGFDSAVERLPDALSAQGFGVITQIDLQQTFKAKLGADFRRYRIFGACNPKLALEVVEQAPHLGLLLPCNIVLYEREDGVAVLGAIDPMKTLGAAVPAVESIAVLVAEKLLRVLAAMD